MIAKQYWLCVAVILAALVDSPTYAQQVAFTPEQGFSGRSHGVGYVKFFLGRRRPFRVESIGDQQGDGTFRLDQTVSFEGEPETRRFWLIRETSPLHYTATLSDAAGPVRGQTVGTQLFLQYRLNSFLVVHQALELNPDGGTIDNVGRITFLGIPIGSLHEEIRRTGN